MTNRRYWRLNELRLYKKAFESLQATKATQWSKEASKQYEIIRTLTGDHLIAAARIKLLGSLPPSELENKDKLELVEMRWQQIMKNHRIARTSRPKSRNKTESNTSSSSFDVVFGLPIRKVIDKGIVLSWQDCRLPYGKRSLENAVRIHFAIRERRWPLIVDSEGIASSWLYESLDNATRIESSDVRLRQKLISSSKKDVIIEIITSPLSEELKRIQHEARGLRDKINIYVVARCDRAVCWSEIGSQFVPVTFSSRDRPLDMTDTGHYLLEETVRVEQPDIMSIISHLRGDVHEFRNKIHQSRVKILDSFLKTQEMRFDDFQTRTYFIFFSIFIHSFFLLHKFNSLSGTSTELESISRWQERISEKQNRLIVEQTKIGEYHDFVIRAYKLYEMSRCLSNLESYTFTFAWFRRVLLNSLKHYAHDPTHSHHDRIKTLPMVLTNYVYHTLKRSVEVKHELCLEMYALLILDSGKISEEEREFILEVYNNDEGEACNPEFDLSPSWISSKSWYLIEKLCCFAHLMTGVPHHILENQRAWKSFFDSDEPTCANTPWPLTTLQKALLYACIHPERINTIMPKVLREHLDISTHCDLSIASNSMCRHDGVITAPCMIVNASTKVYPQVLRRAIEREAPQDKNILFLSMSTTEGRGLFEDKVELAQQQGLWLVLEHVEDLDEVWFESVLKPFLFKMLFSSSFSSSSSSSLSEFAVLMVMSDVSKLPLCIRRHVFVVSAGSFVSETKEVLTTYHAVKSPFLSIFSPTLIKEKRDHLERMSKDIGTFNTHVQEKNRWEVASNALATIHAFRNSRALRKRERDVRDLNQCQNKAKRALLGVFKLQCGILKSDEDNTNVSIYTQERFKSWLDSVSQVLNTIPVDTPNRVVPAAAESEHSDFEIRDSWRTFWDHAFLLLADEYAGSCESEEDRDDTIRNICRAMIEGNNEVSSNPKRELALRERLMKVNSDEAFLNSLVHSFSKVSWRYCTYHEARRVAKLNFMWISSQYKSVDGGSKWNWEAQEIPEVVELTTSGNTSSARVSMVQYRRASQRRTTRRRQSSMMHSPKSKSMHHRNSTMSGLMRWRKFRSSIVSTPSSTSNKSSSAFFGDDDFFVQETAISENKKKSESKIELSNRILNLLPSRERCSNLMKRFEEDSSLLVHALRADFLYAMSKIHHVRDCLTTHVTEEDMQHLRSNTIPSSWKLCEKTIMTLTRWCETIDEHIHALSQICLDGEIDTNHALCLDHLSHPSRVLQTLSCVVLMKQQDNDEWIIQGRFFNEKEKVQQGLLVQGRGQINEEESEDIVLRLFSIPRKKVADYWAQCPSSSSSSKRAVETVKKTVRFDALFGRKLIVS